GFVRPIGFLWSGFSISTRVRLSIVGQKRNASSPGASGATPISPVGRATAHFWRRAAFAGKGTSRRSPGGVSRVRSFFYSRSSKTGGGPSVHERSRGVVGRHLCCGRPTVGQGGTRAPTTSWSLDETSEIPTAWVSCGCLYVGVSGGVAAWRR